MNNIFEAAELYLSKGFKIFPVHGIVDSRCTCGNPECGKSSGKHPNTAHGFKDAVDSLEKFKAITPKNSNIAIRTGEQSGFWVLDVDGGEGIASLGALEATHGPLTRTPAQSTGKGMHILFKHPGVKVKNSVKSLGLGLDVRGDDGYIVGAPSKHLLGHSYQWHDGPLENAPQWLIDLVVEQPAPEYVPTPSLYQPANSGDIQSALSYLNPSMNYEDWIKVGMALHNGGEPMATWDSWSRSGSNYKPNCCKPHWRSFGKSSNPITVATLFDMAMQAGYVPIPPVDNSPNPAQGFIDRLKEKREHKLVPKIDRPVTPAINLDALPPLIADTIKWIVSQSLRQQPQLAFMNVIAALGALYGRRYQSPTGFRTNIYMVGVAPTGAGKEQSRKCIKSILLLSSLNNILGGDKIRSAEGIITMLANFPRRLIQLDELGMFLQAIAHKNASGYERKISQTITQLYTDAQSGHDSGHLASKDAEPTVIMNPNLCIYGTTTLQSYTDALKREAIKSGELNRFIIMPGIDHPPIVRTAHNGNPPESLLKQWISAKNEVLKIGGGLSDTALVVVEPVTVQEASNCRERFWEMAEYGEKQNRTDEDFGPLWIRYAENAAKIASIIAIARSPSQPVIFSEDYDLGERIVRHSVEYTISLARNHMSSGDFERNYQRVIAKVEKEPGIKRSHLGQYMKNFNLNSNQLNELIKTLVDNEEVYPKIDKTTGRDVIVFYPYPAKGPQVVN